MTTSPTAGPGDAPVVDIVGLRKSFGEREVLRGIDLTVAPGEVVCIIGPSGSGKSTLLRTLAGLTPFTGGLRFDGAEVTDWRAVRQRLGYVIQYGGLFPHLTARWNVTLMARELRWPRERIDGHHLHR